ncbi:MAG: FecR domain-containing protein [Acidobacteria bacterium]|nr:FecR domain-containing protein [Acidobacteriota bacterium]
MTTNPAKPARFYVEWWVIQKRIIYLIVTLLILCLLGAGAALYVWKYGNPFKNVGAVTDTSSGARFISFEGDVRVVRAATRETIAASSETRLFPGDTVQTQADGRARISMADGSTLRVSPNSTVIIRDNTKTDSEDGQGTKVRVAVDSGQVNVRTEEQNSKTINVVETKQTQNRLAAQTDASFGVNNADHTEEIRIGSGSIETTTKSGEKTTVKGGEYVAVNPSGTLAKREKLLDVPQPSAPKDLAKVYADANGSTSVGLKWQRPPVGSPSHYRVEVATSPFFVDAGRVTERDQLATTEFNVTDLRPGIYFWRVRATAASGQTSEWSEPQKFIVAPSNKGGTVSVSDWAVEYLGGSIYLVRGHAQPGTTIRIAEREALAAGDGAFQLQITTSGNTREVEAEARDPDGNNSRYKLSLAQGTARALR